MKQRLLASTGLLAAATVSFAAIAAETPYFRWQSGGARVEAVDAGANGPTDPSLSMTYSGTDATIGYPMNAWPVMAGTSGTMRYAIVAGSLPGTLKLDPDTGVISGQPATAVSIPLTVQAEDATTGKRTRVAFTLRFVPVDTVASVIPRVTQGNVDVTGAAYDVLSSTQTGQGSPILLTFDRYRTANGVEVSGAMAGGWLLEAQTASGWVAAASGSSAGTVNFPESVTAQAYRLTSNGAATSVRVLWNGSAPYAPSINAPGRISPSLGQEVSYTLSAMNTAGEHTYAVLSGSLPKGVQLTPDGVLSGAPQDVGVYKADVVVRDSRATSAPTTLTIAVQALATAGVTFPSAVSAAQVATFYDAQATTSSVLANGQALALTYPFPVRASGVISQADVPPGGRLELDHLNPASGQWETVAVGGNGSQALGDFQDVSATSWRLRAVGSDVSVKTLRIAYGGAAPVAPSVVAKTYYPEQTLPYDQPLQGADLSGPGTWTLVEGTLPDPLKLNGANVQGTPTTVGATTVKVSVVDARGVASVPASIAFQTQTPRNASNAFPATAGGTAEGVAVVYDADDASPSVVNVAGGYVLDYGRPISADGWSVVTEASSYQVQALVAGNWATMTNGTPVTANQFRYLPSSNGSNLKRFRMTKGGAAPVAPSLTALAGTSLTQNVQGTAFNLRGVTENTDADPSWKVVSGTFPAGMEITPAGLVTGVPTKTGVYTFSASVTDVRGVQSVPRPYTISVLSPNSASTIFPVTVNGSAENVAALYDDDSATGVGVGYGGYLEYVYDREVTVSTAHVLYFYNSNIKVQAYVENAWTDIGTVGQTNSGLTPTSSTRFRVYNGYTNQPIDRLRLGNGTAMVAPSVTPNQKLNLNANQNLSGFKPAVANVSGAVSYTIDPSRLPTGLNLAADGTISGTPTLPGTYTFPVQVRDTRGLDSVPQNVTITVLSPYLASNELPLTVQGSSDTMKGLYDNNARTAYPSSYGNAFEFTFAREVTADSLYVDNYFYDTNIKFQASKGGAWVDIGSPSRNGWNQFTPVSATSFRVLNMYGNGFSVQTLRVGYGSSAPATPSVTTTPVSTATMTQNVQGTAFSLSPSDVSGGYTYDVVGSLPPGLSPPTPSDNAISGKPTGVGTYNFAVIATQTQTGRTSAPVPLSISVSAPPVSLVALPTSVVLRSGLDNVNTVPSQTSDGYITALYDSLYETKLSFYKRYNTTLFEMNWSSNQNKLDCIKTSMGGGTGYVTVRRSYQGGSYDALTFQPNSGDNFFGSTRNVDKLTIVYNQDTGRWGEYAEFSGLQAGNTVNGVCVTP